MSSFVSQSVTSTSNCIISLLCGILGSLELFIGIQSKSDKEFDISSVEIIVNKDKSYFEIGSIASGNNWVNVLERSRK
jgi:hypothetical protein